MVFPCTLDYHHQGGEDYNLFTEVIREIAGVFEKCPFVMRGSDSYTHPTGTEVLYLHEVPEIRDTILLPSSEIPIPTAPIQISENNVKSSFSVVTLTVYI